MCAENKRRAKNTEKVEPRSEGPCSQAQHLENNNGQKDTVDPVDCGPLGARLVTVEVFLAFRLDRLGQFQCLFVAGNLAFNLLFGPSCADKAS